MDEDFSDWELIQLPTLPPHPIPSSTHNSTPSTKPDTVCEMPSGDETDVNSPVASNNGVESNYHSGPLKNAHEISRIISNGFVTVVARVRCCFGFGFWPLGAIGGALAALLVSFVYAKMKKWRARFKKERKDRLIVLVQEKDQKITQLLFQIAHMKELISARRGVPVLRVNS